VHGSRRPSSRLRLAALVVAAATAGSLAATVPAAAEPTADSGWQRKTPPLSTQWTDQVGPDNALPDYPRPQLTRSKWQNLNGVWQFAAAGPGETPPFGEALAERILVPYPVESALSGIMRHEDRMWYRRTFTVPANWQVRHGQHLLLHFGAVDYDATVYVNGRQVAHHLGGYDSFTADVTSALTHKRTQEIVVGVYDPTDAGGQPVGKQRNNPGGIFYTPSSGIWQTVWMEPVASARIDSLTMTPNLKDDTLRLTANTTGAAGDTVTATAYAGTKKVGSASGAVGARLRVAVPRAKLWSPDHPYLYNLKVSIKHHNKTVDSVGSYFGMRSVGIKKDATGKPRLVLNGKPVFAMATLDQGFWPDGIYTAPTDAALKFDLVQHKQLGFNAVRKHIKVEPDRWYYWADKLGLMVFQDMPAMTTDRRPDAAAQAEYLRELHQMINEHRSDTAIIAWIPFNEGWGEFSPATVAAQVKEWDPSRLVDAESGVNCCASLPDSGEGDVWDDHTYVGPGAPAPQASRIVIDGEYGGLGLKVPGHMWPGPVQAYEMEPDSATLTARYVQLQKRLLQVQTQCGVSAGIYTQITDVENEINGLWTYDRKVEKVDAAQVRNANQAVVRNAQAAFDGSGAVVYPPGQTAPVTSYPLDEGSGAVAHDASGAHDLALTGAPSWVPGHSGSALQFNGSSQYGETSGTVVDTAGNFSVSAWVKLDSTGHFATAVSEDGPSASSFFLQYSAADNRFAFSTVEGRALANEAPVTGQWYHLVGVHDANAGTYTLYVNGQPQTKVLHQCLGDAGTGPLAVGRGFFNGSRTDFWPGTVDAVQVWNRALTPADVAALS
jgi:Concanavalin A-like lectin/glucanases superfamily/Glycosyl hydrolases family 2/Glycosyl hydrolases family 2, sugar binding domain/Glycosyl hydrolases family 2, TIM barrel domain